MTRLIVPLVAAAGLAGCATADTGAATEPGGGEAMTCNAAAAQSQVGKVASAETGTAILRDSSARSLRWGPPRGAWTMDYRQDRVNVRYDEQMNIVEITCG